MAQLAVLDNAAALKYKKMIEIELWLGVLLSVNILLTVFRHYWDGIATEGLSSIELQVVTEMQTEKINRQIEDRIFEATKEVAEEIGKGNAELRAELLEIKKELETLRNNDN